MDEPEQSASERSRENAYYESYCFIQVTCNQGRRNGGAWRGHIPPALWIEGATGPQVSFHNSTIGNFRDAGERTIDELISPCPSKSKREATGVEVPFHNKTIGNSVICKDRLETNLLQLFAHPRNLEWFSIISAIIFEVNVVAAQKQAYKGWRFAWFLQASIALNSFTAPLPYRCSGVPACNMNAKGQTWSKNIWTVQRKESELTK